ncbi:hypothetical protein ACIGW0_23800 [Streptomyces bikiniensis]|uniref:Uncharacterized protein n=1 Tax=Streptomyces bikiniensis TaxID=1896 RepID=A0ABW8CZ38_STRBI
MPKTTRRSFAGQPLALPLVEGDGVTGGGRTQQLAAPVGPGRRGGGQQLIGEPPQVDNARPDTEAARRDLGARLVAALAWLPEGPTCPPFTVFATYSRYRGAKDTQVWPFADHGGGHGTERHTQLNRIKDQYLLSTRM